MFWIIALVIYFAIGVGLYLGEDKICWEVEGVGIFASIVSYCTDTFGVYRHIDLIVGLLVIMLVILWPITLTVGILVFRELIQKENS